jgi:hypothetical protein
MSELDKLLGDFAKRKQAQGAERDTKAAGERELRQKTLEVLTSIVLPAAQEISDAIIEKGHKSKVRESFATFVYPSVEFSFEPIVPITSGAHHSFQRESTLGFRHDDSGTIKIVEKIASSTPTNPTGDGNWQLPSVTEEKVKTRILKFIESVLKIS